MKLAAGQLPVDAAGSQDDVSRFANAMNAFNINTAVLNAASTECASCPKNDAKLSAGSIAGIVCGVVLGLVIFLLVFRAYRRRAVNHAVNRSPAGESVAVSARPSSQTMQVSTGQVVPAVQGESASPQAVQMSVVDAGRYHYEQRPSAYSMQEAGFGNPYAPYMPYAQTSPPPMNSWSHPPGGPQHLDATPLQTIQHVSYLQPGAEYPPQPPTHPSPYAAADAAGLPPPYQPYPNSYVSQLPVGLPIMDPNPPPYCYAEGQESQSQDQPGAQMQVTQVQPWEQQMDR
jgi:hypothetical protein